jgi:hypothetical protein
MCAIGLSLIGVTTIRTMLNSLLDQNLIVRRTVEELLISNYHIKDILEYYQDNITYKHSLKVTVRDLIDRFVNIPKTKIINDTKQLITNFAGLKKNKVVSRDFKNQPVNESQHTVNYFLINTQKYLIDLYSTLEKSISISLKKESQLNSNINFSEYVNNGVYSDYN